MPDPAWVAYTAFGLSVFSTLRPEITTAYNRLLRPPRYIIEENSLIELGFADTGCTLSAAGVIIAENGSMVVRHVHGTVTRCADGHVVELQAKAYKDTHGDPTAPSAQINLPTAFAVTADVPVPYWVMFTFRDRDQAVGRSLSNLFEAWAAYLKTSQQPAAGFGSPFGPVIGMPNVGAAQWWEAFKATAPFAKSASELGPEFFWEAGDYVLTLSIEPVRGRAPKSKTWGFTIVEDDAAHLRENVLRLQALVCGQFPDSKIPPLNFAYVQYQQAPVSTQG